MVVSTTRSETTRTDFCGAVWLSSNVLPVAENVKTTDLTLEINDFSFIPGKWAGAIGFSQQSSQMSLQIIYF